MFSQEKIQQATDQIILALENRQLMEHSINQYRKHYQELNAYIKKEKLISIDENTLLEFLRCQYDVCVPNFHTKGLDRIAGGHIRPLAVLNWHLTTGEIDSRARMRKPPFIGPEEFCDSYVFFMEYLKEKELSHSTMNNYRETAQQFIRHMIGVR